MRAVVVTGGPEDVVTTVKGKGGRFRQLSVPGPVDRFARAAFEDDVKPR